MSPRRALLPIVAAAIGAGVGCATAPTDVLTSLSADATVPPLLILQVMVASSAGTSTGGLRSIARGDAADRPGPFIFPMLLPVNVDPGAAGTVTITINGLDWDTQAVLATGRTTAEVVPRQETRAALTLTGVPAAANGDGGGNQDGGTDD